MSKQATIFGERLKKARSRSGLSQKQLGLEIGLDASVASARMNQYEVGSHHPNYQTAQAIASVLNIPTAYLFCDDQILAEVIDGWSNLEPPQREQVLKIVQTIADGE